VSAALTRLLSAYREQAHAYEAVLELAQEGVAAVRAGAPLLLLHELNVRKRGCLEHIEQIEAGIAADKQAWRAGARAGREALELERLLAELTDLIEQILACERETDRWVVQGAGELPADVASLAAAAEPA
jgi:hypothetical protein